MSLAAESGCPRCVYIVTYESHPNYSSSLVRSSMKNPQYLSLLLPLLLLPLKTALRRVRHGVQCTGAKNAVQRRKPRHSRLLLPHLRLWHLLRTTLTCLLGLSGNVRSLFHDIHRVWLDMLTRMLNIPRKQPILSCHPCRSLDHPTPHSK